MILRLLGAQRCCAPSPQDLKLSVPVNNTHTAQYWFLLAFNGGRSTVNFRCR
jgi:hypothetical protein